jgi:DNA-binding beta-propeller fold protein YncE
MRSLAPAAMLLDLPVDGGRLAAWGRQGADLYFGFAGSPRDGEPAQTIYRISSETWRIVARRNWDRPAYAMKRTGDGLVVVLGPGRTVAGSQVLVLDPETLATRRSIDLPTVKDRKASIADGVVALVSWGNGGRLVFLNSGEAVQPDVWTDEDHDATWERKLAEPARPPSNPLEVALSPDGTRLYTRQFSSLGRWRVSVQDRELTPEVVTDPISSRPFRPLVDPAGEFIVTSADGVVFRADDLASPVRRLNAKIHRVIRLHGRCLAETENRLLLDVESGQPFCHLGSGRVLAADPGGATLLATDDELVFVRIPPDPAELLPEPSPVRSDRPLHVAKQQIEDRTVLVYDEMEFHHAVIPADPNEPVVAVAPLGRLSMIDRRSHREIQALDFGEEVSSLSRCANGIVAALPESQRVWLLDAQTLEPMNSWPVPNLAGAISTPASANVLVTGTDQLGEIDTDAGTVRYAAQAPLLWVQRPPPESPNSSRAVSTSNDGRSIVALLRHSQKLTLNAFLTSSGQYLVHGGRFFKRDAERWVDFGESSREPLGKLRLPGGDLVIDRPGRVLRLPAIERPVLSLENAVRDGAVPRYTASPDRGMIYEIGESIHAWSATGGRRWQLELESAGAARAYVAPEGVVGKHLWAIWQGRLIRVSLDSADQFQTADSSSGTPVDRLLRTLALEKDAYLASLKPTRPNQRISLGAPRGSRYRRPVDLEGEQLLPLAPPIGGRFLILARRDGVVQRLDTRRWTVTSRLEFDQPISDAAVGAWGVAVLLPNQPQVVILDGQTLNPMGSVSLAEKPVLLAASAEYANLIVVDQSMNVHVVDPQSGDVQATLPGPKDTSESPYAEPARAAIGPNGRYVFVSSPQDGLHRFRLTGPEPAFEQRLRAGHWRMPPGSPYLVVNMAAGLHPGLDDDDFCLYAPEDLDQPVRYLGQHRSRPDQVNWCYDPSRRIFLFAGAHNYFAFGIDGRRVSTPEQFSFPNDGRRCVVLDAERYLEYGPRQSFVVEAAGLPRRPIQAAAETRPASRRIRMTRPARSEGFDTAAVWSADGRTMYVKSGTFLRAYDWPTLAEIGKTVAPTAWGQTADGLLAVHDFGDEARVLDPRTLEGIKSFPLRVTGGPDQPVPRFRALAADPAAHFAVGLTIHRDRGRPATVAGFVIDTQFGELLPVFRIDELEGASRIAGELDRGRKLHFDQIRGSELRDDGAALLIDMGERLGLLSVEDMVPRWQQISQQLTRGHHTGMLTVGDWLVVPNAGLGGVQDVHELRSRLLAYRWPTLHRPAREMDLGAPCRADRLALASASPHLLAPAVGGQLQRINLDSRAIDRFALDVLVTAESRLAWGPAERWAAVTNPPELDLVQLAGEPHEGVGRLRSVRLSELPQIRGRRDRESGERAAGAFFELAGGELVLRWDEPDGRRLDFKRWWVSDDSRMAVEVRGDIRRIGLVFGDEQWWLTPPDPQWHRYEFVNRNGTIAFLVDGQAASPRGSPMPATPSRPVHLSMELESGEDVRIRHAVFGRNR